MSDESRTETKSGLAGITRDVRRYVEKRLELFALTLGKQISQIIADSIQQVIGILLISGGALFAWLALAFYVSDLIESLPLGFLLASLPLLLGGFVFMYIKPKSIREKIQTGILSEFIKTFDAGLEEKSENRNSEKGDYTE